MEYLILSWSDVYNLTLQLSERIVESGFKPDIIVGIARGGWIPARILSDVLYMDTLQNIRIEYYTDVGTKGKEPRVTQPLTGSMKGKNVYFEDLNIATQEIIIDLVVSIIENKRKGQDDHEDWNREDDGHEEQQLVGHLHGRSSCYQLP